MFSKDLNCRHIKPGLVLERVNCSSQISSSTLFILHFHFFSPMKRLYSSVPVKFQNVEILLKYEKALWGKWEHTVFLSIFKVPHCCLTLYHTIRTFNDPEKEGLENRGKTRKCWLTAFSLFPKIAKINFNFSVTFILLSPNAFNLDKFKNLSLGKELINIWHWSSL